MPVALERSSKRGTFEVRVDGRVVAERKGGLIAKLLARPYPEPGDVIAAIRAAGDAPA